MADITGNIINVFVQDRDGHPIRDVTVQLLDGTGEACAEGIPHGLDNSPITFTLPESVNAVRLRAKVVGLPIRERTFEIHDRNCTFVFDDLPRSSWVISIHGIRTRGAWQKELTESLNAAQLHHDPFDYGFFNIFRFLYARSRDKQIASFVERYTRHVNEHGEMPSIIAHSLGTYIVCKTMEKYLEIRFDRVILCGSIVRDSYPWSTKIPAQLRHGLNDFGRRDFWAAIAAWVIFDAGPSGTSGFKDDADGAFVQRNHPDFRHSDYFYVLNYRKNWIPFLKGEALQPISAADRRPVNWRFRLARIIIAIILILVGLYGWRHVKDKGGPLTTGEARSQVTVLFTYSNVTAAGVKCSNGRIEKRGTDGGWIETIPSGANCKPWPVAYEELGQDPDWFYLWDTSRHMTARLPKKSGSVEWVDEKVYPYQAALQQWNRSQEVTRIN